MVFKKTLLAVTFFAASATASALPIINGGFEFFASGSAIDTNNDGVDDAFDFANFGGVSNNELDSDSSTAFVNAPITGTFSNIFGTSIGLGDLFVKDIAVGSPAANNPFWSLNVNNGGIIGTVTFTATSAGFIDGTDPLDMFVSGKLNFTALNGCVGTCAFEETDATWTIASTGQNSIVAASVPEPSSIALLGLGLAGLGFARRNQNKA